MEIYNLRVGIVYWQANDDITKTLSKTLLGLGCTVKVFAYNALLPQDLDVVWANGPYGSLTPLAQQLIACPTARRPAFILMLTEQLPDPDLSEWFRSGFGRLRSRLERLAYYQPGGAAWQIRPGWGQLIARAHRFRYYGDLFWLQEQGLLTVLAVPSSWTADFLRARGFSPVAPCLGWDPDPAPLEAPERDIPVLWLGKAGSTRRKRLLSRVRAELKACGVELLMVDGIEHPYVFGLERTMLLNRTQIVLNLLRAKWDDNSMRYILAAPQKALIISEPTLPHTPFKPGVHLVESPIEQLADTICYYLIHPEERERIVEQAYYLAINTLSVKQLVIQLLKQVIHARSILVP